MSERATVAVECGQGGQACKPIAFSFSSFYPLYHCLVVCMHIQELYCCLLVFVLRAFSIIVENFLPLVPRPRYHTQACMHAERFSTRLNVRTTNAWMECCVCHTERLVWVFVPFEPRLPSLAAVMHADPLSTREYFHRLARM